MLSDAPLSARERRKTRYYHGCFSRKCEPGTDADRVYVAGSRIVPVAPCRSVGSISYYFRAPGGNPEALFDARRGSWERLGRLWGLWPPWGLFVASRGPFWRKSAPGSALSLSQGPLLGRCRGPRWDGDPLGKGLSKSPEGVSGGSLAILQPS